MVMRDHASQQVAVHAAGIAGLRDSWGACRRALEVEQAAVQRSVRRGTWARVTIDRL